MIGDLLINGVDASTHGITMGSGFLDALGVSITYKDDLENESAIEHGKRVVLSTYYASRDVTLTFVVRGADSASFRANDGWLLSQFYTRKLTIKVKGDDKYYRLVYTGKGVSYAHSPSGTSCTRVAKFTEINPNNRGSASSDSFFSV